MTTSILEFDENELEEKIKPKFRVAQVLNWIFQKYVDSFDEMKNIPQNLREELQKTYTINPMKIVKVEESRDGSKKYLFELVDGHTIETVLLLMRDEQFHEDGVLKHHKRYTVCISSQVGCKIGCAFCSTAKGGFIRNLSVAEIVGQILMLKKENNIPSNHRLNIVYMGMGEPLDNFDNVVKAIKVFANKNTFDIAPARQTISTSGLSEKIIRLGKLDLKVNMAISLHAVDDALREKLMPINKAYNIKSIIEALKTFPINDRKRIMFEYLMMKDVNDDILSAKKLLSLLNGIKAKVNLIYFNDYDGSPFKRPSEESMVAFQSYLISRGQLCTIRESKGLDISAACGQLREKELQEGGR
ncbi:MAG: 23S rRNA (adenine(2503)-C(2))-methyltransferase RlmN [Sulfurovum sp.]|nr:MAG: 23S rRNA (adenine(2503)-C(2))-methyltransferase RlmN [Sulfurovum sp.]